MTGPAARGTERGTRAPSRLTGTQGAVGAILVVLALGLALRLILAYLLPTAGFGVDLGAFRAWALDLARRGLYGFYLRDFFHDYTPGYLYVLWLLGLIGSGLGGVSVFLIKIPAILADLAIGWLVWSMILELGGRRKVALAAAFVAVMNPISWFDSAVWGQVDSVGVVFLLLGLREIWRDHPERAAIYAVVAALIKPQLGILIPILALVTIRRAFWPVIDDTSDEEAYDGDAVPGEPGAEGGMLVRLGAWERRTDRPIRIVTTGLVALITTVLICLPFGLSVLEISTTPPYLKSGLLTQIFATASGYPYVTVNAFNPWALVVGDQGYSLANSGAWICDGPWRAATCGSGTAFFGGVPAVVVGTALMLGVMLVVSLVAARRPDRLTILLSLAILAIAFYVVPTRVHERYAYPAFALAIILAAFAWRWRVAYVVFSVTVFLNMYAVLTNPFYRNPGISDWLGISPGVRSEAGVVVLALLNGAVFAWAFLQARRGALDRLADEHADEAALAYAEVEGSTPGWEPDPSPSSVPGAPWMVEPPDLPDPGPSPAAATAGAAGTLALAATAVDEGTAPVRMPSWSRRATFDELGVVGWFSERLHAVPIRPDRSLGLRHERGGRLDRLDLWLVVVLILGTMLLRTFRLAEPYQMHFDEVYHARTATEFLQKWRYGLDHDIYEYTHPHLAKYAMAAGIVLWGGDEVAASSELGVPVRATVVEARRADPLAPRGSAGERLHVATGTEIRTYDLRTRALISTVRAPGAGALAVDTAGDQLVIGFDDGRIATLDLGSIGDGGIDIGLEPVTLATVDHPVDHLLPTAGAGVMAAASSDRLSIVDKDAGTVVGTLELDGIADLAEGGTGEAVVATVDEVTDPTAVASSLAEILPADATEYASKLASAAPGSTVVLGSTGSATARKELETAIADGTLPGIRIDNVTRTAVATAAGVAFIDAERASIVTTVPVNGGARGLALVTGLENPKLYATSGDAAKPTYVVIHVGGDPARNGPVTHGTWPLPGLGSLVTYDEASQMVHILGLAPGATSAGPWTVYVVQPHGNAVYADARLPDGMDPAAWAADFNPEYPADDRQQLLVFGGDGAMVAIDTGWHAFAWRMPGVIAGAITAALLYLLARILFRRRLIAGLLALFVIADGMFFVQSRIGMNDVYVGLFIVAAYTVFAAVWTGWWRGRASFWIAMPVIGVLLGLALASKWVAAYAIGALLLLILIRSALGRVLAILGLIGLTGILGYMAISVPAVDGAADPGFGNLTFLLIMVGLTLLAVVVAVVHPVAWTDDEMRFAVGAPVALGILVFFGALAMGRLDAQIAIGAVAFTPLHVAFVLAMGSLAVAAVFWVAGRWGFGPLATPPAQDDPIRLLEPPGAPPEGWLRPGHLAGLPVVWMAACLVALPVVVYVITFIPWAMLGNNQLVPGWPAGHTGQSLLDLTLSMYSYHNTLSAAHPASSPWWAWPMNLKPVWFYQEGLAAGTAAALYDAGSLVIWWMGIPAIAFVSWMAFKRRSLALTLIAIGFAAQWIPWARIDRAAFQYHYYTALPFVVLALAYFVAEIWHGASRHAWALARIAAAIAIMGPAILWSLDRPLCYLVGVESVNPGSAACPAIIPSFVLTVRAAALATVVIVGVLAILLLFLRLAPEDRDRGNGRLQASFGPLVVTGSVVVVALVVAAFLPDATILTLTNFPVEPIAIAALVPLGYLGLQVFAALDARRFVAGFVVAVVGWFVILYPNISALPLPAWIVPAYQGILPTYLYAFQFPVSKVTRGADTPLLTPMLGLLLIALTVTCLVVAYSAWVWRLTAAEAAAAAAGASEDADGLARSGGA